MSVDHAAAASISSQCGLAATAPGRSDAVLSIASAGASNLADKAKAAGIRTTRHRAAILATLETAGEALPIDVIAERAGCPVAAAYRFVRQLRVASLVTRALTSDSRIGYRVSAGGGDA